MKLVVVSKTARSRSNGRSTLTPNLIDARYNLGNNLLAQGRLEEAVAIYKDVVRLRPDHAKAHSNLGNVLQTVGRLSEAQNAYVRTLELDPSNHAVQHMLHALRGETVARPPPEFVTRLFDRYAPRFEAHVTKTLEYSIPRDLRDALAVLLGENFRFTRAVDLGAGTGLCGIALQDHADEMIAIDVSANMLSAARNKAVYDSIVVGDIVDELNKRDETFDLFVAADVFIYLGALESLFTAVSRCRSQTAVFAFSIERCSGADFVLQQTGRYAHAIAYIERLSQEHNFDIARSKPVNVRKEKEGWIAGDIFLLRAQG